MAGALRLKSLGISGTFCDDNDGVDIAPTTAGAQHTSGILLHVDLMNPPVCPLPHHSGTSSAKSVSSKSKNPVRVLPSV